MIPHIALGTFVLLSAAPVLAADDAGDRSISHAETVLVIYTQDWRLAARPPWERLILGIWPDGHIVWSEDRIGGGPPYRAGHVPPKRFASLLSKLERDGVFSEKELSAMHVGPDTKSTIILIRSGKHQLVMDSWHELYEARGKVVATPSGLMPLHDRRLYEVLKDEPGEYLLFRLVWSEIRARAAELVPSSGTPVEGRIVMNAGVLSWRERGTDVSSEKRK